MRWPLGPPGGRMAGQAGGSGTDADPYWALRAPGRGPAKWEMGSSCCPLGRVPPEGGLPSGPPVPPSHQGQSLRGKGGQRTVWKADLDGSHVNGKSQGFAALETPEPSSQGQRRERAPARDARLAHRVRARWSPQLPRGSWSRRGVRRGVVSGCPVFSACPEVRADVRALAQALRRS